MKFTQYTKKIFIPVHLIMLMTLPILFQSPQWIFLGIITYIVTSQLGFEIGFHRYLTHRSFKIKHELVKKIILYLGAISGLGQPIFFVCMHKKHHAHADTTLDPHSPTNGIIKSSLYNTYLGKIEDVNMFDAKDALRDPFVKFLDRNFYKVYWITFLVLLAVWWPLAIFGLIYGTVMTIHSFSLLNVVLVHYSHGKEKGYRNFNTPDTSTNRKFYSYILFWYSWGGFLHNNHHALPSCWFMDHRPGEFDFGKYFVKLIKA